MGLSEFHSIGCSMPMPLRVGSARSHWSNVPWRAHAAFPRVSKPADSSSLQQLPRFLFQTCAISPHFPDRALKSIQRNFVRRRCSWTTSTLRRWMLPTVERGPPIG